MTRLAILLASLLVPLSLPGAALAQSFDVTTSTYLGGGGEDALKGARIQSSAAIIVGGRLTALPADLEPLQLGAASERSPGVVLRLSPDAASIVGAVRLGEDVHDLDLDASDRVYAASGEGGIAALDARLERALWSISELGYVHRISAGTDGTVAALVPSNRGDADSAAGQGRVHLFGAGGAPLAEFEGWRNTQDVCVDSASRTVILIGWRQASAFDGDRTQPVQIAYVRGVGYDGQVKWTAYDWSVERDAEDFLNRPENNMADTRGYRCSVGADGKLYAAFESAGGNHIFRYSPYQITQKVRIVGGDEFHEWYNSRAEHKLFFARFEPGTGEYLLGQQFAGRLSSGRTNTVRAKGGEIVADARGRVVVTGASAAGLPIPDKEMFPGTGDYKGGAYLLIMSADFTERLWINRVSADATGHAADVRSFGQGRPHVVQVGSTKSDQLYLADAWQGARGGGEADGFLTVLNGIVPPDWDPDAAPIVIGGAPDAGGPGADAGSGLNTSRADDGCGCAASGARPFRGAGLALVLFVLGLALRRPARAGPS